MSLNRTFKKIVLSCAACAALTFGAAADDAPSGAPQMPPRGFRGGPGGRGFPGGPGGMRFAPGGRNGMRPERQMPDMLARFRQEHELRKKFPEEFSKLEKAFFEAEQQMIELAKGAKMEFTISFESKIRQLRAKAPDEFAQLLEKKLPRREEMDELRKLAEKYEIDLGWSRRNGEQKPEETPRAEEPANLRRAGEVNLKVLRRKFPKEVKALEAIRKEEPEKFKAGIIALHEKLQQTNAEAAKDEQKK